VDRPIEAIRRRPGRGSPVRRDVTHGNEPARREGSDVLDHGLTRDPKDRMIARIRRRRGIDLEVRRPFDGGRPRPIDPENRRSGGLSDHRRGRRIDCRLRCRPAPAEGRQHRAQRHREREPRHTSPGNATCSSSRPHAVLADQETYHCLSVASGHRKAPRQAHEQCAAGPRTRTLLGTGPTGDKHTTFRREANECR
jgi:hypothetical protein